MMNGRRKSDRPVVATKPANKVGSAMNDVAVPMAEQVERRGLAKGKSPRQNTNRALDRAVVQSALGRIRQAAVKDRNVKFTSLMHHIYNLSTLREAYYGLKRDAAPGVDGETWRQYGEQLESNLTDLAGRLRRGAYRAKPVLRSYITKDDGRQRPLGITALEDQRVVRLIRKWLNAGVLEQGEWRCSEEGTPQGGSASPLLANIYLHYVFDLWVQHWRKTKANGDVIVVRWADDFVVGFQHQSDAERFHEELAERFAKFKLKLHPEKTRVIEFGFHAANNRKRRGQGRPETFNFLGFTHICGKKRSNGMFTVLRRTMSKRKRAKLKEIKTELRKRMHHRVAEVGKWLRLVVEGHNRYYGVPSNSHSLASFRFHVARHWYWTLRRRSQTRQLTWKQMYRLIHLWLPLPRLHHPYPLRRLGVIT
jgi:retron-type reverse transcriptase